MSDPLSLGKCCACGASEKVRNIVMHDKYAPIPGTGWGCVVCGLPLDGAISVVCDHCLETRAEITLACRGYPSVNQRVPIEDLSREFFGHDIHKHAGEMAS